MAQPSVASFFSNRKRTVIEDAKISRAKKEKEEKTVNTNKLIAPLPSVTQNVQKKAVVRAPKSKKAAKELLNNKDIQQLLSNMKKMTKEPEQTQVSKDNEVEQRHVTPPSTPTKCSNLMDKVPDKIEGPTIQEIKKKMTRSGRLAELKATIAKLKEGDAKLKEVEKKTSIIPPPESPKLKAFRTIEVEVHTSPQKAYTPEKAYLSPKKDVGARRNLLNLMSPTKNAMQIPSSPRKLTLDLSSKPALSLPFKYRYLAEMFRSIDTVVQILYNRKETITFRKLKPAVEEMLKRNLLERHLAQIKYIYEDAFTFTQEKLKVFGVGMKKEQWELVITPNIDRQEHMTSEILLERRRILFDKLMNRTKDYHHEFLMTLDPPMNIEKGRITKWHPEFDIEKVPDIEQSEIPKPPVEEILTTGQNVLEKARELFNCNTRMEQALQRLKTAQETNPNLVVEKPKEENQSVLKGIPKALLEKVRQRQAAKALVSMTRSADKEKEVTMYNRLPELARLTRNLFVSEKKGVLPLETVVEKLGNCHQEFLTKSEMEDHLKIIAKEVPGWLVLHNIRNTDFVKLSKNADLSIVMNKLDKLAKQKRET
ncbi:DNA replication factor Cdt1 isoform X3 [Aethina tumida]|uniref:DNA replication factor Cdt1 isoform X3 n=1 Tax=Aethina tumida TaxID=116153 RepID=UPI00096B30BB|nr:DNA replication factor Cdt1 isoform X3 [Aethina tumida]